MLADPAGRLEGEDPREADQLEGHVLQERVRDLMDDLRGEERSVSEPTSMWRTTPAQVANSKGWLGMGRQASHLHRSPRLES